MNSSDSRALERWLADEVAKTYDAHVAEPDRALPLAKAFDAIRARHATQASGED